MHINMIVIHMILIYLYVAQWLGGIERWTCDDWVVGLILTGARLCSNLWQVVHTCVPLSPSKTWYRLEMSLYSDFLWVPRVP